VPVAGLRTGATFGQRNGSGRRAEPQSAHWLAAAKALRSGLRQGPAAARFTTPTSVPRAGEQENNMDGELKQYLDAMEARIIAALDRLRSDLIVNIESHAGEKRVDAVSRKLEGET
jgi:hypothetical protein